MSWLDRFLPPRRTDDTTAEAHGEMRKLEGRDAEVHRLGHELREAQRRNHFSEMVNEAIGRNAVRPGGT